jgi:hypothetical protein
MVFYVAVLSVGICCLFVLTMGHAEAHLVVALCYKLEGRAFDSRWCHWNFSLTLSKPIFLPPAYSPALINFWWERGWCITCNYPTVLKEKTETEKLQLAISFD